MKTWIIILLTCLTVYAGLSVYRAGAEALRKQADRLERAYNIINN
jgi:hypothetical protein